MIKRSINSFWIDILVAFSCISVVYLHVNNDVFWQRSHGWLWISSNIIECLFYAAVPCFFMISGYTLMDYRERYNTKVFLKRRLFRAFLPFIFWSFVFFHIYHKNNFILSLLTNNIMPTYDFFLWLFLCYISIIFLSRIQNKMHNFLWLAVLGLIVDSIIPFLGSLKIVNISDNWLYPIAGNIWFVVFGYIFGNIRLSLKWRYVLYFIGILGLMLHFFGTLLLSPPNSINRLFKGYINFPSVFYSIAIFVWFRYHDWKLFIENKVLNFCVKKVRECSLGIYLIHFYFLTDIMPHIFSHKILDSDIYRVVFPLVLITFLCLIITSLSKIIPPKLYFLIGYKKSEI